jgi:3-hydroxy-3-methylglutaryl CoA synthase
VRTDTIEQLADSYAIAKAYEDQVRQEVNAARRQLSRATQERSRIGRMLNNARTQKGGR